MSDHVHRWESCPCLCGVIECTICYAELDEGVEPQPENKVDA